MVVLACAVGAEDAEELALRHLEVEVVYGCKFAELFCKGVRFDVVLIKLNWRIV